MYFDDEEAEKTLHVKDGKVGDLCNTWTLPIILLLARAVGVAVGRRSGGRLATTLVATKNVFIFFLFFFFTFSFSPSRPFLIEGVLGSKNLFSESGSKWPIT